MTTESPSTVKAGAADADDTGPAIETAVNPDAMTTPERRARVSWAGDFTGYHLRSRDEPD
ncbi:hypothetical protein [Aeromicrobium sp. UC242_57]|uniref:hypothetical protein n=1 Tax=Aeromicrobium sp. UC242_57 TaxID=3374624 RepID=UPI003791AD96